MSVLLRSSTRVLIFSVEDVDILNTRLPKLQVGPNVAKRKGGTEAAHAIIDTIQRPEAKDTLLEGLRTEAGAFYASVQRRVAILVSGHRSLLRGVSEQLARAICTHVIGRERGQGEEPA